jgi:hypothetical protein
MFLKIIFTDGFITSIASENRFLLAVLSYPPLASSTDVLKNAVKISLQLSL